MELETKTEPSNSNPNYLMSLTIENFRCFKSMQTLNLSNNKGQPARWTVILGDNGTGKTTLLRCLAAIDSTAFYVYGRYLESTENNSSGAATLVGKAGYSKSIDSPLAYPAQPIWRLPSANTNSPFSELPPPPIYGYGAARQMQVSTLRDNQEDIQNSATLFYDDVMLMNAEEWLLRTDYAAYASSGKSNGSNKPRQRVDQIKQMLVNLLPGVSSIEIEVPSDSKHKPHVKFNTRFGPVSIHDLSLGYRTMAAWTVDLAQRMYERYPDSPDPLAEPAIVLVDEIDLHLHPQWQRDLIRFLTEKFPNTQFIVTAHSAIVVQAAADANIVLLRPYTLEDGTQSIKICNNDDNHDDIRGYRVDQILTSDLFGLDSSRSQHTENLLNERRKILSQPTLTEQDKRRVEQLEAEIGPMPGAESRADIEAMEIIRRAAELLKSTGGSPG